MKKENGSILERAAEALDLPSDIIAGLPRIEIVGCREVMVENHKGILEYQPERIRLAGGRVVVAVFGRALTIRAMNAGYLLIGGVIQKVEFEY